MATTAKQTLARSINLAQAVVDKYRRYVEDASKRQDPNDLMLYEARLIGALEVRDQLLQQEHEREFRLPAAHEDKYLEVLQELTGWWRP